MEQDKCDFYSQSFHVDCMNSKLLIKWRLPDWIRKEVDWRRPRPADREKIGLAIRLADLNVAHRTGGPFGAAVFNRAGELLAVGVNRVVEEGSSLAHAEIVALTFAQQRTGRARLHGAGELYTLASSAQPCAMCLGALLWAGIGRLLYGASRRMVESLTGFDEGPVPGHWRRELKNRGIEVRGPCRQTAAAAALRRYRELDGELY